MKTFVWFALLLVVSFAWTGSAHASDISGTITTTLSILEDSKLVGDVTCTVSGAVCITLGASGVTLDLNGFTMTGLADAQTGCSGKATAGEFGIYVNTQNNEVIRGPGVVRQFRNQGIALNHNTGTTVTGVTTSTNCGSGIFVFGGSDNELDGNVSVRNGFLNGPCGGI